MKMLGFSDPQKIINEEITLWGNRKVIGVVKDFHQESLKKSVDQLIFVWDPTVAIYFSIKLNSNSDIKSSLETIERKFTSSFPGNPFRHFFLNEYYDMQYRSDLQFGKVFGLFTIIAIVNCRALGFSVFRPMPLFRGRRK